MPDTLRISEIPAAAVSEEQRFPFPDVRTKIWMPIMDNLNNEYAGI